MGTAESSQSSELDGIGGFNSHSSFHRQSPNVARLICDENSQKMEYEFPISDTNATNLGHSRYHNSSTTNRMNISGKGNPHISDEEINHNDSLLSNTNSQSNKTSNLWSSLTSCFGGRASNSNSSTMSPLRDKVYAIRIVRASNDLTPAVFDSQYNIITLEQLREREGNASGNFSNTSDSINSNDSESFHNKNGSVSSRKNEKSRRMKKKKKNEQLQLLMGQEQ